MAIDGQNLRGAFPVYDTSRSVGTYTANLQKQAAQRQAEQKALSDDLGKIKIDGLRDADKDDYFKGFEDWRTTAQQAMKEKDFRRKAELQSESDKKYLGLQNLVNKSKEYNRTHQDVSMKMLDDKFRDQFADDAVEKWRKSGTLPLSSKDIIIDPTALGRQMDLSGVQKKISDANEDLLKQAKYANPITRRINSGNKVGTESIYSRTVDPKQQALTYAMMYDTDRDIRNYIRQEYADQFKTLGEDEAKAFAIQDIVSKAPIQRQDAPKVQWDDNWKEKALFNDALARKRKADGMSDDDVVTYDRQDWVRGMLSKTPETGERLKAVAKGRGYDKDLSIQWQGNNLVIEVPPKTTEKKKTVDGNEEVITDTTVPGRRVTIDTSDKNAESQLNAIVNEVTGDKISETKFKTGNPSGKVTKAKSSGQPEYKKTISKSEIAAKASAAGYSISEYEKLLKQKGVKIQ